MMQRRDFMKSGLMCLASVNALPPASSVDVKTQGAYKEGGKVTLSNPYLELEFTMSNGEVGSTILRNKLTDRLFRLTCKRQAQLTFSGADTRIEIPWWNVTVGREHDDTPYDQEKGFLSGYHLESYRGDADWGKTLNLLLRNLQSGPLPPVFKGYAWFRQSFELPEAASGKLLTLCLGGYSQEDWNEYWIYINGIEVGHWNKSGRWREPEPLVLNTETPAYAHLRFGEGQKNLLAIRTYQYDKSFEGLPAVILDRFVFDQRLSDQFITVGEPYRQISDFKLRSWRKQDDGERANCAFEYISDAERLQLTVHYLLQGFTRRKWLDVTNLGGTDRLLLDVDLDVFEIDAAMREGDYGQPLLVGEELFCAVEHPAGLNQGLGGGVRLRHFPGKKLPAGATFTSKVAIVGVAPKGEGSNQFLRYIRSRCPRKGLLSIYDPFGINGYPDSPCWTLDDREMLETMDLLEEWKKEGVAFDYYVPDVGWQDRTGDMTRFWPQCFPNGPEQVIKRANQARDEVGIVVRRHAGGLERRQ